MTEGESPRLEDGVGDTGILQNPPLSMRGFDRPPLFKCGQGGVYDEGSLSVLSRNLVIIVVPELGLRSFGGVVREAKVGRSGGGGGLGPGLPVIGGGGGGPSFASLRGAAVDGRPGEGAPAPHASGGGALYLRAASAAGFGLAAGEGAGGGGAPEEMGLTGAPRGVLPRTLSPGGALAAPAIMPANGSSVTG